MTIRQEFATSNWNKLSKDFSVVGTVAAVLVLSVALQQDGCGFDSSFEYLLHCYFHHCGPPHGNTDILMVPSSPLSLTALHHFASHLNKCTTMETHTRAHSPCINFTLVL